MPVPLRFATYNIHYGPNLSYSFESDDKRGSYSTNNVTGKRKKKRRKKRRERRHLLKLKQFIINALHPKSTGCPTITILLLHRSLRHFYTLAESIIILSRNVQCTARVSKLWRVKGFTPANQP